MPCGGSLEVGRCVLKPAMSHSLWDALNTITHLVFNSLPFSMNIDWLPQNGRRSSNKGYWMENM